MADFRKKKNVMAIPLNTDQIAGTPWVEGTCVTAMGKVYFFSKLTLSDFQEVFSLRCCFGLFASLHFVIGLKKSRCQSDAESNAIVIFKGFGPTRFPAGRKALGTRLHLRLVMCIWFNVSMVYSIIRVSCDWPLQLL